jgi:ABC-type proline/glycine betaine transport system substrate-binding protein
MRRTMLLQYTTGPAFIHGFSIKYEDINSLVLQMMKSGGKGSAAAFDWVRRNRNSLTKLYPGK